MRRSVRVHAQIGPEERLSTAIASLDPVAQRALVTIADREDLPLVAGTWGDDHGGCLVANVVSALAADGQPGQAQVPAPGAAPGRSIAQPIAQPGGMTVDMQVLELLPQLSSRDLNTLVVAWDEAAMQEGRATDAALRRLLRGALARAGVPPTLDALVDVPEGGGGAGQPSADPARASR